MKPRNIPVVIAEAEEKDLEGIAYLQKRTWLSTYVNKTHGLTKKDVLSKQFQSKKHMRSLMKLLHTTHASLWTAKMGEEVVGYTSAERDQSKRSFAIYVLPDYQRRGIGTLLLQKVLGWLGDNEEIVIRVIAFNIGAINFYERFRFEKIGLYVHDDPIFPTGKHAVEVIMKRRALHD